MSYVKTQWVDNVTDIDKDNLNKIEQGIYDNSLVVDAVTNTLNPTDTETYKTAELTEGQITDVIGVSDIVIKGQTSQDGTPTPSAPVDVNVVSGSNVINTSTKNLFDKNSNAITVGYIGANGNFVYDENLSYLNKFIKVNPNTKYTISSERNDVYRIAEYDLNKEFITRKYNEGQSKKYTITTSNNTYYIKMAGTSTATLNSLQLEQGSTATTYEPHQGKELPLDLGKNLLPNNNISQIINGVTFEKNNNNSIKIIGKATAQTDYYLVGSSNEYVSLNVLPGTYNLSGCIGGGNNTYMLYMAKKNSEGTITYHINKYEAGETLTVNKGDTFRVFIRVIGEITIDTTMYPQLEKGSLKTSYMPYKTPIELCKIGDYQDYFYKSGSKWYLHKGIEKVILDGSENWVKSSNSNVNRYYITGTFINVPQNANTVDLICDYFKCITQSQSDALNLGLSKLNDTSIMINFALSDTNFDTLAKLKEWLSNTLVKVNYVLKTPTDTEITDTTLISQLEAIYNAPLYEETNITQENNDLPMVLDITACKDNINGIKAFIRK